MRRSVSFVGQQLGKYFVYRIDYFYFMIGLRIEMIIIIIVKQTRTSFDCFFDPSPLCIENIIIVVLSAMSHFQVIKPICGFLLIR